MSWFVKEKAEKVEKVEEVLPPNVEVKRTNCRFCHIYCPVMVYVRDKKEVYRIEGDPQGYLKGFICHKAKVPILDNQLDHPSRVNFPYKRIGKRGEGRWQRITWQQALDEIAAKLKEVKEKYGPEAILQMGGSGGADHNQNDFAFRFNHLLGTPNYIKTGKDCGCSEFPYEIAMYGYDTFFPPLVPGTTKCILLWGRNPACSSIVYWQVVLECKRRGAKIISVDPKFAESTSVADLWLQIRPGTDGALALGMLNVIIREDLYDKEFVERWTDAHHLYRMDTRKLLRERDIRKDGKEHNFAVWDTMTKKPLIYDSEKRDYGAAEVKPALTGTFKVELVDGTEVECKTVWQAITNLVQEYPPEKVEVITWVPEEKIVQAARMYVMNKPAVMPFGVPTGQICGWAAGQTAQHYRCILRAITGNLDVVGGQYIREYPSGVNIMDIFLYEKLLDHPERKRDTVGSECFPIGSCQAAKNYYEAMKRIYPRAYSAAFYYIIPSPSLLWKAVLEGKPYPIKAIISNDCEPFLNGMLGNTKRAYEVCKSENLELLVSMDFFWTPIMLMADYALPAACWLEKPNLSPGGMWGLSVATVGGERVVEPMYERRDDYYFFRELGKRLGQAEYWPWETVEECYSYILKPSGLTFEEFLKGPRCIMELNHHKYEKSDASGRPQGFATYSGKVELVPSILEDLGYDSLPRYEEPAMSPISRPTLAKEYPLILTSAGRSITYSHSMHRQLPTARKMHPWPYVHIYPGTARGLDVNDGDWVWIETPFGRARMVAKYDSTIHPKVVAADTHWYYPEEAPEDFNGLMGVFEASYNTLIPDEPEYCDHFGNMPFRSSALCKIYKAMESPRLFL